MADPDAALTAMVHQQMPFAEVLGLDVLSAGPDAVAARGAWTADRCTAGGLLHGGYLVAVSDSVGAVCTLFNLPTGASTATIETKTNFFRAVAEGSIDIVSTPVHVGRSTIVVQTDIRRADGELVSRTTQTQAVLTGRAG